MYCCWLVLGFCLVTPTRLDGRFTHVDGATEWERGTQTRRSGGLPRLTLHPDSCTPLPPAYPTRPCTRIIAEEPP